MAVKKSAMRTIYHKEDGAVSMYEIDATHALKFRDEWSPTPWSKDGEPAKAVVEIPADWENGTPRERIDLALRLGAPRKGLTAAHADEVILEEVERRAEAPAEEPQQETEARAEERRKNTNIPNDWSELSQRDRTNLAVSLGAPRAGLTPAGADAVIQAEVDRRARSQGRPSTGPRDPVPQE